MGRAANRNQARRVKVAGYLLLGYRIEFYTSDERFYRGWYWTKPRSDAWIGAYNAKWKVIAAVEKDVEERYGERVK